ncbi:MAG: sucrose synthase, partial [bacterium]
MSISLNNFINESELSLIRGFFYSLYKRVPDPFYLRNDILLAFGEYKKNSGKTKNNLSCDRFLQRIQELLIIDKRIVFVYRPRLASSKIYSLSNSLSEIQEVSVLNYLRMKERIIKPELPFNHRTMQLNFSPFFEKGTHIKDPDQIGKGITHLNRYLSSYLFQNPDKWKEAIYEFLSNYNFQKTSLLVNSQIVQNQYDLEKNLEYAVDFLERKDCCDQPEQPDPAQELKGVNHKLNSLGFLAGWGDNLFRILESMRLLKQVLEQPDENIIEEFMSRIPMISCIAVISPHGWFGQSKVMGRPDTGGQVVYILDQVKALEKYIINDLKCSGIEVEPKIIIITRLIPENEGTTSNIRKERVLNTQNSWIIRVPFKDNSGNIVPGWISRFHVWPYLDQFAVDSMHEVCSELSGKPDLIIGNYSDGNLVATLMANALGSIQCNIAHALEKTKYLFSDLYWEGFEEKYRFSLQFMADLISMNQASIIISSTAHEIKGTDSTIGQYESYRFFSLPGLMQVTNGINLFHHKFNIIP